MIVNQFHLPGAGVTVPSVMTFLSGFYFGWCVCCYAGDLSELCHERVTHTQRDNILPSLPWSSRCRISNSFLHQNFVSFLVSILATCWAHYRLHFSTLIVTGAIAERSKAGTVYDCLSIGITGLNPGWGMDVCPCVSVLCCPASVEALHQADPLAKESYQMSIRRSRSPLG
jgi:hypothetical protein